MRSRCCRAGLSLLIACCMAGGASVRAQTTGNPAVAARPDAILATVDGWPLTRRVVRHHLALAAGGRQGAFAGESMADDVPAAEEARPDGSVPAELLAGTVEHLIRRELVLGALQSGEGRVGPSEVRLELGRIDRELQARGDSLAGWVQRSGLTREEYERELLWRLAWRRHLERELTAERMAAWFERHHFRFDGSTMRVDQIVWLVDPADAVGREQALAAAGSVFEQLRAGGMEWEEAVRKWSQSPLAQEADRPAMGWIGYHGPMPELFAAAAFALQPGEISEPVQTPVGVHLIRCLEWRRGKRTLEEELPAVRRAMAAERFEALAAERAGEAVIVRNTDRGGD